MADGVIAGAADAHGATGLIDTSFRPEKGGSLDTAQSTRWAYKRPMSSALDKRLLLLLSERTNVLAP